MSRTLGLDLGTNSIGWAIVEEENGEPVRLVASGSRIFQEAVTAKDKVPKNRARREKRGMRKTIRRRAMRRDALTSILQKHGMLPERGPNWDALFDDDAKNPYEIRTRGLDHELSLLELGRAIYHINRRRGFKSNRKAMGIDGVDDPEVLAVLEQEEEAERQKALEKEKRVEAKAIAEGREYRPNQDDEGVVLSGIARIREHLGKPGARTLGEYLCSELQNGVQARRRHTERSMFEDEFDMLWQKQATFHPNLTDALKAEIHQTIFWQRPLKVQRFLVGKCSFETDRNRADKAYPEAQEFRIWQDITHILLRRPGERNGRPLSSAQRLALAQILDTTEKPTWASIKKKLKIDPNDEINLEAGGKDGLIGNRTNLWLRKDTEGKWDEYPNDQKESLMTDLLTIEKKASLIRRLRKHWGFSARQAYNLAVRELDPSQASLSLKAIRKILPFLKQGQIYSAACASAGYDHSKLKDGGRVAILEPIDPKKDRRWSSRNPVVDRCLNETRKLVNAVIKRYGLPDVIRLEMARDMKLSKKQKDEAQKKIKENERLNIEAEEAIRTIMGIQHPSRNDKLKYRLWIECNSQCPYTGTAISETMLFGPQVDIEHIIPYSISLDDSQGNKTLCMAEENRLHKSQKTPFQAYHSDPARYNDILKRVHKMKCGARKKSLFAVEQLEEDFTERQLNDTRYVSRLTKDYLKRLGCEVQVTKGEATSALRHTWGLDTILGDDGEKNRADHRHHAIDAIVIALTSRSLFKKLSDLSSRFGGSLTLKSSINERKLALPEPWEGFRNDVEQAIKTMVVSHQTTHKVSGALHEETAYGYRAKEGVYVFRKSIHALTKGEIGRVRDPRLRSELQKRLAEHGGDEKAFAKDARPIYVLDRSGVPARDGNGNPREVKAVRLDSDLKNAKMISIEDYKFFPSGSNHHVEIVRDDKTGKKLGVFVSMFDAARRANAGLKIVQKDHGPGKTFLMSLSPNDMVCIPEVDGSPWYRVQKLAATNNSVIFRAATDSKTDPKSQYAKSPNTLSCTKVHATILGEVTESPD